MESWRELVLSFCLFLRSTPFAISGHRVPPRRASRLPKLFLDRQLFWRAGKCRGIGCARRPISLRLVGAAFPLAQPRFSRFSPAHQPATAPNHRTAERTRRSLRDSRTIALFSPDRTRSAEAFRGSGGVRTGSA